MVKKELSKEQLSILNHVGNIVVLAKPGSGKTFTISEKIKKIISEELLEYEGVIAISYTNKASKELKDRVLKECNSYKGCYFNTMDAFLLTEIVYPFGQHVFGNLDRELKVFSKDEIEIGKYKNKVDTKKNKILENLFRDGIIIIDYLAELSIYIINNSKSCREYLRARYKYIFIDEYQDCGKYQHGLFLEMVNLGITGVAVGDIDQSIYKFSGKDSKYLLELSNNDMFQAFILNKNYRCHQSIVDYSTKLINKNYKVNNQVDSRVFHLNIEGTQKNICKYIDKNITKVKEKYNIENNSDIAILVRGDTTGSIVNKNLKTSHKYFITTDLDKNSSVWCKVFKRILTFLLNDENIYEVVEDYFEIENKNFNVLYNELERIKKAEEYKIEYFIAIANIIYPDKKSEEAIGILNKVIKNDELYYSYKSADNNEIQIMSIHKSKGLEFKIVFHLDLYKYIMPSYRPLFGVWEYDDIQQCKNLHYVAITRAIEACFMITSTSRYNSNNEIKNGVPSEFLYINNLQSYRKSF